MRFTVIWTATRRIVTFNFSRDLENLLRVDTKSSQAFTIHVLAELPT